MSALAEYVRLAGSSDVTRRARGDGGLHWDEHRQRWIATTTIGYDGRGKRVVRKASGRTRTEAKNKLRDLLRDQADGLTAGVTGYTVRHAVEDWLAHGLGRQSRLVVCELVLDERGVVM